MKTTQKSNRRLQFTSNEFSPSHQGESHRDRGTWWQIWSHYYLIRRKVKLSLSCDEGSSTHSFLSRSSLDAKLEDKHSLPSLNEIAYLSSCNNILFFEARRQHGDLYLWAAKAPNGPSCRFHVLNSHTMDEMKMTGNCLKGSRPVVVFDQQFDESPHMKLIKEVLTHVSSPPLH